MTAIMIAVAKHNNDFIQLLQSEIGIKTDTTALITAAKCGNEDAIEWLLAEAGKVNL
jgi:hypothetical protein